MGHGFAELASDIRSVIESAIPGLREPGPNSMLEASIEANVQTMLGILAHGTDPADMEPPIAAVEYARRLAQRGVSTFALIRAYRLGQAQFLRRLIEDLIEHGSGAQSIEGRATLLMVDRVTQAVDKVVEALLVAYARAREEWLSPEAITRARVRSVLNEKSLDVATAQERLGAYAVRQHHLGIEVWINGESPGPATVDRLRELSRSFAAAARCSDPPLFVAIDESSACTWLPLGTHTDVDRDRLSSVVAQNRDAFAAVGEPEASLSGFRRTHEQAMSAAAVAHVTARPPERLTPYAVVAPIAAMSSEIDATRKWVAETLGLLAADGERQAGLRETLRVFLASDGSFAATAKKLGLHRNTAQYRVRVATEMRGRSLREGRLDVELALLACHWFGEAVLQPAT